MLKDKLTQLMNFTLHVRNTHDIGPHPIRAEAVEMTDVAKVVIEEVAQLEAALTLIGDIAYDRDGYTGDAEKLAGLVDELYRYARNPAEAAKLLRGES